jgi:hypothetical protein
MNYSRGTVQSFRAKKEFHSQRIRALVLKGAAVDGQVESASRYQRALLIWKAQVEESMLLPGMVEESLRLLRWQKGILLFRSFFHPRAVSVATLLERWFIAAAAAREASASCRLIRAEAASDASEAELEISALKAELVLCQCQGKLQTAETRNRQHILEQERHMWEQERRFMQNQLRKAERENSRLREESSAELRQAEESRQLMEHELSSYREFISSSASHSASGIVMPAGSAPRRAAVAGPAGDDAPVCYSSASTMRSPARLKRESIAQMTDDEILQQLLQGIGEEQSPTTKKVKEEPLIEWHGGPPLQAGVVRTAEVA